MSSYYTNLMSGSPETASSPLFQGNIQSFAISTNNADAITSSAVNNQIQQPGNKVSKKKNALKKESFRQTMQVSTDSPPHNFQPMPMTPQGVVQNLTGQNLIQPFQSPINGVRFANCQLPYGQALPSLQMVRPTVQIFPNGIQNAGGNMSPLNIPNCSPGSPQYLNNMIQHPLLGFRNIMPTSPIAHININNANLVYSQTSPAFCSPLLDKGLSQGPPNHPLVQNNVKRNKNNNSYISCEEVEEGLRTNTLFRGALRVNPKNPYNSYVTINQTDQDILIEDFNNRNRALDGDIVIIQLLDEAEVEANRQNNKEKRKNRDKPQVKQIKNNQTSKKQMKKHNLKIESQENNETATRDKERVVKKVVEHKQGQQIVTKKNIMKNKSMLKKIYTESEIQHSSDQDLCKNNLNTGDIKQVDCNIIKLTDKINKSDNSNKDQKVSLENCFRTQLNMSESSQSSEIIIQQNSTNESNQSLQTKMKIKDEPDIHISGKLNDNGIITIKHDENISEIKNESIPTQHVKIKKNKQKKIKINKQQNINKNLQTPKDFENCDESIKSKPQQYSQELNTHKISEEVNKPEKHSGESDEILIENNATSDEQLERKVMQGKVVYIEEKVHPRICVGFLKLMPDKNKTVASLQPRDPRVPLINIPCTFWPDNFYKKNEEYANTLFLAKILVWNELKYATGIILSMIGTSGELKAEQKAILAQNGLDVTPFDPSLKIYYPTIDYEIPPQEIKLREDCRKLCLFAIDPYNCRDIDDAVSCRELDNGNYEIGVHISDVSYYLIENTPLDEKVSKRATTVYMVERAFHMLPDDLCLLCSLFPGKDKLAFSVFWEITKDAKILSHRFSKSLIHSCAQLSYEHAQDILDGKNIQNDFPTTFNGFKYNDICKNIKILGSIAAILRKNRYDGGALRIDQLKIYIKLNTSGLPEGLTLHQSKESHQLIEEFMLLANCTVAKRIHNDFPKLAFLRCHEPPNPQMMRDLDQTFKDMDLEFDVSSAGDIYRSLLKCTENKDVATVEVLTRLCAKPMARARYFCSAFPPADGVGHYALNVPLYTHFTSPIRRYADIMVHRLMSASLKFRDVPKWDVKRVKSIAATCNLNKQNSKLASEMSTEVYLMKYINMNSPMVMDAIIADIKPTFLEVVIPDIALTKRVFLQKDLPATYKYTKNVKNFRLSKMEITWDKTDDLPELVQTLEIFSHLKIHMVKADDLIKVNFSIQRPEQ